MCSKTRREVRAFVDTNVLLIGAVNLALQEETAEVKIIRNLLEGGVKLVTSLKQLEELTFASKKVLGRDFAGWIRYLLITKIKPLIIHESAYRGVEKSYAGLIPDEDLTHFAVAVTGEAEYIVSENHEFLRMAAECKTIECLTSEEFIKETATPLHDISFSDSMPWMTRPPAGARNYRNNRYYSFLWFEVYSYLFRFVRTIRLA